ncbi:MAG: 5-formyltetrahydrofolate cyclo-ligase [Alphaproteobacteria bacterium]|nr:5-formyltetrahydrofolate cyclo-ligase [Alphaproteobacteria bacterium]
MKHFVDKPTLRKQMLVKRMALSDEFRAEAAQALVPHLLQLIPEGAAVAGYSAIKHELDVFPSLAALSARGNPICLPDIAGREAPLIFLNWKPGAPLIKGSYAIQIPQEQEQVVPQLLLVPLVAFDQQGNRLGYGAGYYDLTIASLRSRNPHVKAYGIGYSMQQVDEVPSEPHDIRLDGVVTEKGIM